MEANENLSSLGARWARYLLLAGIAALLLLILAAARSPRETLNPFSVRTANADMIAAAPNCLVLTATLGTGTNFYLVDSTKKVICVYQMDGEKIRLVAAREYKQDVDIVDASLDVGSMKAIEGGNGVDRETAEKYAEALKSLMEKAEKEKK